jgi:ATP-dependent Clp protease ATP-binding subunit ClpA
MNAKKLLQLETFYTKRVVGQKNYQKQFQGTLREAELNLNKRPIGSFYFKVTGVGKAGLAKRWLAIYLMMKIHLPE